MLGVVAKYAPNFQVITKIPFSVYLTYYLTQTLNSPFKENIFFDMNTNRQAI